MGKDKHLQRILLGLKVRQLRQSRGWNFDEMSRQTGMSPSYLNEIEKGKKYPQPESLEKLAAALGVSTEFLTSAELPAQYAPISRLLESNFLSELPLDFFGLNLQQLVEIMARAPDRVNAFVSAMLDIARHYSVHNEHFYFAALRAYQELHLNYFPDIEATAAAFAQEHQLPVRGPVSAALLERILLEKFNYTIDDQTLGQQPLLQGVRAAFHPEQRRLYLHPSLHPHQRAFQLAKELGFATLQLEKRPCATPWLRVRSFEEVLNNYRAAYFAVSILVPQTAFIEDLHAFFLASSWQESNLLGLLKKYQVSPEVLFQRFNVLSHAFDLHQIFFLRLIYDVESQHLDIDKELHLNRRHRPQASGLGQTYCRRWLSADLFQQLHTAAASASAPNELPMAAGAQHMVFADSGEEYLCLAVAKTAYPTPNRFVCIMLGVEWDDHAREVIRFSNDPTIERRMVGVTCERCSWLDCPQRSAAPSEYLRREQRRQMENALNLLTKQP
ncbi:MAG: helix-turn-helix domain-containing protein [Saprospiraceae bacterium]|nr:helix-turn-helix domain-containing protein [Saprospiraceae bacterium]MDW8229987.1 helix-turn-helix domain-containing protein [Saprospiraceae bacterium]